MSKPKWENHYGVDIQTIVPCYLKPWGLHLSVLQLLYFMSKKYTVFNLSTKCDGINLTKILRIFKIKFRNDPFVITQSVYLSSSATNNI